MLKLDISIDEFEKICMEMKFAAIYLSHGTKPHRYALPFNAHDRRMLEIYKHLGNINEKIHH